MLGMRIRSEQRSKLVAEEHQVYRHVGAHTSRFEYGYRMDRNLRSDQMRVSASLPEMAPDMRPLCQGPDRTPSRQSRWNDRVSANRRAIPWCSVLGLRGNLGIIVLAVIVFSMMFFCLWSYGRVSGAQKEITDLQAKAVSTAETRDATSLEFENSLAGIDLPRSARDMGMVSAKSVTPISLYVTERAVIQPSEEPMELPVEYLATIMGY